MAVQFAQKNNEEKPTLSQRLSAFFMAHRKVLIAAVAAVFVAVIAMVIATVVRQSSMEKAYQKIDELVQEWSALSSADGPPDTEAESRVIASLEDVASSNGRNFVGARANLTLAEIYYSKEDWDAAKGFYEATAAVSPKFYTTGLALYNAAVCAEEMGLLDEATALFERAEACANFPQKARCRFNIARIQETSEGANVALESYRAMVDLYPSSQWTDLARSRIIALEIAQDNN